MDVINPKIELDGFDVAFPSGEGIAVAVGKRSAIGGVSSFGFGGTNAHVLVEAVAPGVDEGCCEYGHGVEYNRSRFGWQAVSNRPSSGPDNADCIGGTDAAGDAGSWVHHVEWEPVCESTLDSEAAAASAVDYGRWIVVGTDEAAEELSCSGATRVDAMSDAAALAGDADVEGIVFCVGDCRDGALYAELLGLAAAAASVDTVVIVTRDAIRADDTEEIVGGGQQQQCAVWSFARTLRIESGGSFRCVSLDIGGTSGGCADAVRRAVRAGEGGEDELAVRDDKLLCRRIVAGGGVCDRAVGSYETGCM